MVCFDRWNYKISNLALSHVSYFSGVMNETTPTSPTNCRLVRDDDISTDEWSGFFGTHPDRIDHIYMDEVENRTATQLYHNPIYIRLDIYTY
jgi:hypothetical protein